MTMPVSDRQPTTAAGRALHDWWHDEWGTLCDPDCDGLPRILAIEDEARAAAQQPAEGREELWAKFTAGEKLAYGVGYRDAQQREARLRELERLVGDLDNLAPMWPKSPDEGSDWTWDALAALGALRAALLDTPEATE